MEGDSRVRVRHITRNTILWMAVSFPKKLEYGEVVSQAYKIHVNNRELYEKALENDPEATIQVISSTTIGEIYQSNEYPLAQLIENFKYLKDG